MDDGGWRYGFSGGSGGSCSGGTTGGLTVSLRSEGKKMGIAGGGPELLFTVARQVGRREGDDWRGMERRGWFGLVVAECYLAGSGRRSASPICCLRRKREMRRPVFGCWFRTEKGDRERERGRWAALGLKQWYSGG
ncbi:hypothetical protein HAX54_045523, partial [Datura stramonium]|nr:hypothetical protein [Datura stramonium]